eukprot:TRINITY_DN884_c0_g2_i6.p1 TRINITY_DN884_c0_g2~~TRINITY_DN884_c0_g2_i6.p1  ORF type:complete len:988 (-),score=355.50 TRINITY_DN884_c0_g2_i6:177-3023(-)
MAGAATMPEPLVSAMPPAPARAPVPEAVPPAVDPSPGTPPAAAAAAEAALAAEAANWECAKCGESNKASRTQCNNCAADRPPQSVREAADADAEAYPIFGEDLGQRDFSACLASINEHQKESIKAKERGDYKELMRLCHDSDETTTVDLRPHYPSAAPKDKIQINEIKAAALDAKLAADTEAANRKADLLKLEREFSEKVRSELEQADIAANEQARTEAEEIRKKENEAFVAFEADSTGAIGQMGEAITTLSEIGADQTMGSDAAHEQFMAGHPAGLLKLKSSVKQALLAASAFTSKKQVTVLESFIQQPSFTGAYSSQSGEVVGILRDMKKTFENNLETAVATEKAAVEAHTKFMEIKLEEHTQMTASYEEKQSLLSGHDTDLASATDEKATAEGLKAGDEDFLASLVDICAEKAKESQDYRDLAVKEAIIRNDNLAKVAGKIGDVRKETDFEALFDRHELDIEKKDGAAAKAQFQATRQQQRTQTGAAKIEISGKLINDVRQHRMLCRDEHIVNEAAPMLAKHESVRTILSEAADLHQQKQQPLTGQLKAAAALATAKDNEVVGIVQTLTNSKKKAGGSLEALNAMETDLAREHNQAVVELLDAIETFKAKVKKHATCHNKLEAVRSLKMEQQAYWHRETERLDAAEFAAKEAQQAIADWKTTATNKAEELDQLVSTSLQNDREAVQPIIAEEATNIRLASILTQKTTTTQREELDKLNRAKMEEEESKANMAGKSGLESDATLLLINDNIKELDKRKTAAEERLAKTRSCCDDTRSEWDKLVALPGFGRLVNEESAEKEADAIASGCYDAFNELQAAVGRVPVPVDKPELTGFPGSPRRPGTGEIQVKNDLADEMERMKKMMMEMSEKMAYQAYKIEEQDTQLKAMNSMVSSGSRLQTPEPPAAAAGAAKDSDTMSLKSWIEASGVPDEAQESSSSSAPATKAEI